MGYGLWRGRVALRPGDVPVNVEQFQRGQVAAFAFRAARRTGSLDAMKAIVYVLRNRVKAGWCGGSWLQVMDNARMVEGNPPEPLVLVEVEATFDPQDRLLQMLLRDLDEIYLGGTCPLGTTVDKALYYQFVDRPVKQWFIENIIRQPAMHRPVGTVHPIQLYE